MNRYKGYWTVTVSYPGLVPYVPDAGDWNCYQWKGYYLALKANFGKEQAVQVFSDDFSKLRMLSFAFNMCKYDCDLYHYFRSQGIDLGWAGQHLYCAAEDLSEGVEDVAKTVKGLGNLIGLALVGAGAYWVWQKVK